MPTTAFDPATLRLIVRAERAVALLFPWPSMHAFESALPGTNWSECIPHFVLPREEAIDRSQPPAEDHDLLGEVEVPARTDPARIPGHEPRALVWFCQSIPPEIRALVRPFHEQQWRLLAWLVRAGPGAEQLVRSNPALAFMLAFSEEFSEQAPGGRSLAIPAMGAYRRQRELVGRLGFPARESVRRLLAKVAHDAIRVEHLKTLRAIAARPDAVQRLAHLTRINVAVIGVASGERLGGMAAGVLEELAQAHHDVPAPCPDGAVGLAAAGRADGGGDAIAACNADGEIPPPPPTPEAARGRRAWSGPPVRPRGAIAEFPLPPVPGTPFIVPLVSRRMLVEEGESQQNCVADYAARAQRGTLALYRVLQPERCTLSLQKKRGVWEIGELKAARNQAVKPETRQAVRAWLVASRPPASASRQPN